jgi:rSAM/selenodomain-associated transferase 1
MTAKHRVLNPLNGDRVPPGLTALAVMTKAPQAGRVKTRLTPPLSPEEAAALNICFLRDTAAAISRTSGKGKGRGVAVYTPSGSESAYSEILPDDFILVPQRQGGFGERLLAALTDLLALGFDSVCLIDSDSPTVPDDVFAEAVALLRRAEDRVVLGPSDDGGYYLIGLKKPHRRVFEEIDWSTDRVLHRSPGPSLAGVVRRRRCRDVIASLSRIVWFEWKYNRGLQRTGHSRFSGGVARTRRPRPDLG